MKKYLLTVMLLSSPFHLMANESKGKDVREVYHAKLLEKMPTFNWDRHLAIFDLALESNPQVCVEIGVLSGETIAPTALALQALGNGGVVYAIDPWELNSCLEHWTPGEANWNVWADQNMEGYYQSYLKTLEHFNCAGPVITLRMRSDEAIDTIRQEALEIDILMIDANHSENAMYYDTTTYVPLVKVGGYIWFDDMGWTDGEGKSTSKTSIDYLEERCTLIKIVNGCGLFKKFRH